MSIINLLSNQKSSKKELPHFMRSEWKRECEEKRLIVSFPKQLSILAIESLTLESPEVAAQSAEARLHLEEIYR